MMSDQEDPQSSKPRGAPEQAIDVAAQSRVQELGETPATVMRNTFQAMGEANTALFQNMVSQQQQQWAAAEAAMAEGIVRLLNTGKGHNQNLKKGK